jgi:group I intron endonuclease
MIKNKVTKKFYIGKSKDLKGRFYNYLNIQRLMENKSSRIHKALLKFGFENFSITILEFIESPTSKLLNEREDFYIKVFKPQYNIKRSQFNMDKETSPSRSFKLTLTLPKKIQSLLEMCLDPSCLD